MHLEWEKLRAVDLFVLFSSFLPTNGVLKRVAIYQSDFGVEKMKLEETSAPPVWNTSDGKEAKVNADGINEALLRKYELEKLKYYYGVAEFDSVETASHVHTECDGQEFQRSSNFLDLRFIPDDFKYPDRDPRDEAFEIPSNYNPPDYFTQALQHTKIELTWEKGDEIRDRVLTKTFHDEKMNDFAAYLGTESDDISGSDVAISASGSDTDDESGKVYLKKKARAKYAALLGEINQEKAPTEDLEITFMPGLKEVGKKIIKDKEIKDKLEGETPWEKYLREKKEKRKEKKSKEAKSDIQTTFEEDEVNVDKEDAFFNLGNEDEGTEKKKSKKDKKNKKVVETEEEIMQRNQLELLMMDPDKVFIYILLILILGGARKIVL